MHKVIIVTLPFVKDLEYETNRVLESLYHNKCVKVISVSMGTNGLATCIHYEESPNEEWI